MWCWEGGRSCFSGLMSHFKNREASTLLQMEIQPLLMSGAFAWKILFPSEVNIYCKSTVCSGAESGARILQETVYARAVPGANSKFPEAECEELVLRVACSQTCSSSRAWALQRREGVTKTMLGPSALAVTLWLLRRGQGGLENCCWLLTLCSERGRSLTRSSEPWERGKCFWK